MKLLNVGAGGNRPQDERWWNLDDLHRSLQPGTPERIHLDKEPRYVDHELLADGPMPFEDGSFEGCLCSHVIEHFTCHDAVLVLKDCRRILKPGGLLVVSVPDAGYFLEVHDKDKPENAVELFGEPIHDKWQPNFMSYALFHREHRQILTAGSLMCLLIQAGFQSWTIKPFPPKAGQYHVQPEICKILNRQKFSLILSTLKS